MLSAQIPLEDLLATTNGSVYKLTILAAKRALQLADGEKTLVARPSEKILDNVFREIVEGKIKIRNNKEK